MLTALSRFLLLALLLASAPSLHAKEAPASPWPLPANETFLKGFAPPPAEGSPAARADVLFSQSCQATATPEQIAQAVWMVKDSVFTYSLILGPRFNKDNFPATAAFFKKLKTASTAPKNFLKDHFHRVRPVLAHPDVIKELIPLETGFSYPSGHATRAWLYALALGDLDPARRFQYIQVATQVGLSRVIGGVHYQTDVIASRALATALYDALKQDPGFQKDLQALRDAEWTPAPPLFTEKDREM